MSICKAVTSWKQSYYGGFQMPSLKSQHTSNHANEQTNKQTNKQTTKQTSKQTNKQANKQTIEQVNKQKPTNNICNPTKKKRTTPNKHVQPTFSSIHIHCKSTGFFYSTTGLTHVQKHWATLDGLFKWALKRLVYTHGIHDGTGIFAIIYLHLA